MKMKKNITKINPIGEELLNNPVLNKGTAFTKKERAAFGLHGKLPPTIETLEMQVARAYQQYQTQPSNLYKNIFLHELHANNQTLFYKFAQTYLTEILPILYTPSVAEAVTQFSQEFRRPKGVYISYPEKKHLEKIFASYDSKMIDLIVVTDGEGVLGIGDQGIGSIQIVIAKAMLYSLFANINPARILTIVLDVGTNNKKLIDDPTYLGWRHERLSGKKYTGFIDSFVNTIKQKFPQALLHWEDFGRDNAAFVLERYQKIICSFNDDIQGTAVVTVAALLAALKNTNQDWSKQRIVIFGAGTAGTGIANQIVKAMMYDGYSEQEAFSKIWMIDKQGLLLTTTAQLTAQQQKFAKKPQDITKWKLKNKKFIAFRDVVKNLAPTILIGCSTQKGAFTEEIVCAMAKHTQHPIIFPLSNPNEKCEATPENLIHWTNASAIIATGSPFAPVTYKGKTITIAQCNNALVFPGIGLGVLTAKATQLTDTMLWAACETLVKETMAIPKQKQITLLPPLNAAPNLATQIALAVATQAYKEGLSEGIKNKNAIPKIIKQQKWKPRYTPFT